VHDESHVNRFWASYPPAVVLSPAYMYPEVSSHLSRPACLHLPRTHLPPRRPPSLLPPREGRHIECVLNVLRVVLPEGPLVYESLWSISGLSPQRPETLIHSGVSLVYHLTGTIPNHPSFIDDRSFLIDDWSFLIDDRSLLIDAYPPCRPVLTNPQSRLLKGSL